MILNTHIIFKNKLNNYIFFEIIKSYLLVLISLSLLIWIAQAAKHLNLITETGLSITTYITYVALIYPKIISQLMLISFLVSCFISLIKLLESKEIEIYWMAGISKFDIAKLILKISVLPTILSLFFYLYLAPFANLESRRILANSEFSMVNSLVKKNNFNSPLKNLTIFVNKNDNSGNIEKIFIFEDLKTIIAKKGRILNFKNKNYLELTDGFIHEKKADQNIEVVKFEKTIFDFTKYQTELVKTPKNQEQKTLWLINQYLKPLISDNEKFNLLEEIHKRIFKPLFIPIIAIFCCFLLFTNNEKINLTKLKIFIFSFSTFFLIFIEILLNISVKSVFFQIFLYILPLLGLTILMIILKNFLNNEPILK